MNALLKPAKPVRPWLMTLKTPVQVEGIYPYAWPLSSTIRMLFGRHSGWIWILKNPN